MEVKTYLSPINSTALHSNDHTHQRYRACRKLCLVPTMEMVKKGLDSGAFLNLCSDKPVRLEEFKQKLMRGAGL